MYFYTWLNIGKALEKSYDIASHKNCVIIFRFILFCVVHTRMYYTCDVYTIHASICITVEL